MLDRTYTSIMRQRWTEVEIIKLGRILKEKEKAKDWDDWQFFVVAATE